MKKRNIVAVLFTAVLVATGISSCKKNKDCISYTYDGDTGCVCVSDFPNREAFDAYVTYLKSIDGVKVTYTSECK